MAELALRHRIPSIFGFREWIEAGGLLSYGSNPGVVEARGEPIVNPVTKEQHRARFDMPNGFEFTVAEGRRRVMLAP